MKAVKREGTPKGYSLRKTIDNNADVENNIPRRVTRRSTALLKDAATLDTKPLAIRHARQGRIQKPSEPAFSRSSRTSKRAQAGQEEEIIALAVKKEDPDTSKVSPTAYPAQISWYYRYKCCICSDLMSDSDTYTGHLKSQHDVLPFWNRAIKRADLVPDINNINNYCTVCRKKHPSNEHFREHLLCVHHMVLSLSDTEFMQVKLETGASQSVTYPDPKDPSCSCKLCDITFDSKFKYRDHLRSVHKMKVITVKRRSRQLDPDVDPDWNDPNAYCRSCNFTFRTNNIFHAHCKSIHKMKPPVRKSKLGLPDLEDPNFYCKVCDISKPDRGNFRQHCREVHHMATRPIHVGPNFNPDATPELDNENNYCVSCDKTYADRASFRQHLRHAHKTRILPPRIKMKDIEPIINDPNHYCRSCERKLSSKNAYEQHIQNVHRIELPIPIYRMPDVMPDVDDPNFYCRACEKAFRTKHNYRNHLKGVHKMRLESLLPESKCYSDLKPDPFDPNFYCRVCKNTKKSLTSHRVHCREVHNMTLAPLPKVYANPDAVIDEKDPNLHCAKCDQVYRRRQSYIVHLRNVHKLQPRTKFVTAYPDKEVDIHHPGRFCAKCDKAFSSNTTFRQHLEARHNIIVSAEELTQVSKSNRLQTA